MRICGFFRFQLYVRILVPAAPGIPAWDSISTAIDRRVPTLGDVCLPPGVLIRRCRMVHHMRGTAAYLLRVVIPNIARYDSVYKRLVSLADLCNVSSALSITC